MLNPVIGKTPSGSNEWQEGALCLARRVESVSMQAKLHGEHLLSNYPIGNGVHGVHHQQG